MKKINNNVRVMATGFGNALASIHSSIKLDNRYHRVIFQNEEASVVAIFHKKCGMMEDVEVGVRNGRMGERCEMGTEGAFLFSVRSCFKLSAQVLQCSKPALQHCETFENSTKFSAIL